MPLREREADWQQPFSSCTTACQSVLIVWNRPIWQEKQFSHVDYSFQWPCWHRLSQWITTLFIIFSVSLPGCKQASKQASDLPCSAWQLVPYFIYFLMCFLFSHWEGSFSLCSSLHFVWDSLQSDPLFHNSLCLYSVFVWDLQHMFFPSSSTRPGRPSLNATEMSVTFTGCMWTADPGSAQCPLSLQCHPWFGAPWQRPPFTATACLLSSISLEFHCSGWEAPEASRQTWSQWRNTLFSSLTL